MRKRLALIGLGGGLLAALLALLAATDLRPGAALARAGTPAGEHAGGRATHGARGGDVDGDGGALATREELLARRAAGLTGGQLLADLANLGADGTLPDHTHWVWRASALLELHPELCAELVPVFAAPGMRSGGRGLILDLLVAAGHGEAQAAMRAALATPAAHGDRRRGLLVQRLGLVEAPDAETAAFAAAEHERALTAGDAELGHATAFGLASVAGRVARAGDADAGRALTAPLVEELERADTPEARAALTRALGNARLPEHVPLLQRHAADESPEVRMGAAAALGQAGTADARRSLLALLADPDPGVQGQALAGLAEQGLVAEEVAVIARLVVAGGLHAENQARLVDLAVRWPAHHAALVPALRWLADHAEQRLAAQARALL